MSGFEGVKVKTVSRIAKFVDPDGSIYRLLRSGAPLEHFLDRAVEVKTVEGNVFLIEGVNFIWNCTVYVIDSDTSKTHVEPDALVPRDSTFLLRLVYSSPGPLATVHSFQLKLASSGPNVALKVILLSLTTG